MTQLTTQTARRLKELKSKNTGHDYNWEIKEIISVKNELKEIHDSEECACNHNKDDKCGYGVLIQEIESVEVKNVNWTAKNK